MDRCQQERARGVAASDAVDLGEPLVGLPPCALVGGALRLCEQLVDQLRGLAAFELRPLAGQAYERGPRAGGLGHTEYPGRVAGALVLVRDLEVEPRAGVAGRRRGQGLPEPATIVRSAGERPLVRLAQPDVVRSPLMRLGDPRRRRVRVPLRDEPGLADAVDDELDRVRAGGPPLPDPAENLVGVPVPQGDSLGEVGRQRKGRGSLERPLQKVGAGRVVDGVFAYDRLEPRERSLHRRAEVVRELVELSGQIARRLQRRERAKGDLARRVESACRPVGAQRARRIPGALGDERRGKRRIRLPSVRLADGPSLE